MAIETHESVLEDELKNFESSMESELKENIGGKKAELQGISNSITEKENEILKIQQEIVALKQQKTSTENYIQTRQQKVDLARRAFNSAYEAVKKILFNNKQNINNHIKGE
jgi:peptidoglycan hydrolase CwlO-like protein